MADKKAILLVCTANDPDSRLHKLAREGKDIQYTLNSEWVMVQKNGKWGWVDHAGKTMIPCRYEAALPFEEDGTAAVLQFGEVFRINKQGLMVWERR